MANLTCRPETVLNYSALCLGDDPPADCFPDKGSMQNIAYHTLKLVFISCGLIGNLATLLAIPHAMWCKKYIRRSRLIHYKPCCISSRFGFKPEIDSTTVYILNLAFVDFIYCASTIAVTLTYYTNNGWPFGLASCKATFFLIAILVFLDWFSLTLITFSRFVLLKYKRHRLFTGKASLLPLLGVWVAALGVTLSVATEVSEHKKSGIEMKMRGTSMATRERKRGGRGGERCREWREEN